MNDDKELLMERLERLAIVLDEIMPGCAGLVRYAIALLKEQEPLEPITDGNEHIHVFRCRKCNRILQRNNEMDYCPKCGQAVKWK